MNKQVILIFLLILYINSQCVAAPLSQRCDPTDTRLIPCFDNCTKSCGNGELDTAAGEECDSSVDGSTTPCSENCKLCGNDQTDGSEDCDITDPDYDLTTDGPCN